MSETFGNASVSPARAVIPVTPSDSAMLPDGPCRALLVGAEGAATIIDLSGQTRADVPLQQGYNPIGAMKVFASGLGADNIWALY